MVAKAAELSPCDALKLLDEIVFAEALSGEEAAEALIALNLMLNCGKLEYAERG